MKIVQEFKSITATADTTRTIMADGAYRILVHVTPNAQASINKVAFVMYDNDPPWPLVDGPPGSECHNAYEVTLKPTSGAATITFILERIV